MYGCLTGHIQPLVTLLRYHFSFPFTSSFYCSTIVDNGLRADTSFLNELFADVSQSFNMDVFTNVYFALSRRGRLQPSEGFFGRFLCFFVRASSGVPLVDEVVGRQWRSRRILLILNNWLHVTSAPLTRSLCRFRSR
jgi:hypothetical protein